MKQLVPHFQQLSTSYCQLSVLPTTKILISATSINIEISHLHLTYALTINEISCL